MSILNGNVSDDSVFPISMPFGDQMHQVAFIAEPSVAVAEFSKNILICGGKGAVSLYSVDENSNIEKISSLKIFGNSRQIGVLNNFVYVSTRESGVAICDFSNLENPILAHQIDSLELATGIAVSNGVLAITNRHMGCELYDVRDPYNPVRMGDFYCGEAQSVYLYEKFAVVSHWIGHEAAIFDISNPSSVKKLSTLAVDGYADGVCVVEQNNQLICLVGTGHHSARLKNHRKYKNFSFATAEMIAEGYGTGHGVEIFNITNPLEPKHLSNIKTPPHFGGPDTWLVYSDGDTCVFTDSMNGVFTISLKDLANPQFTGYYKLKPLANQRQNPPSIQVQTESITGAALVSGFLCVASADDGVHILNPNNPIGSFVNSNVNLNFSVYENNKSVFYSSMGQIHGFVEHNGMVYVASGELGIEVIDTNGNFLFRKETKGICNDLCLHNGRLYVAEGDMGVAAYDISETLTETFRLDNIGCVKQIVEDGNNLVAQIGCIKAVKLTTDNDSITLADGEVIGILFYHRHLSRTKAGKYVVGMPLSTGPILIETQNELKKVASFGDTFCNFSDGACGYDNKLIIIYQGKYACLDNPLDISNYFNGKTVDGALLSGIPYVLGNTLVLLNRCTGMVEVLDITDPYNPKFVKRINTNSYPEACGLINNDIFIALGFDGILKI